MNPIAYNIIMPKAEAGLKNYNALNPTLTTRIEGSENEIYLAIDFINQYLRFLIIIVVFFAIIYMGIRVIVNPEAEKTSVIKNFVLGIA